MIFALASLLAMQPVGQKGHSDWIKPDDYPVAALNGRESGYVGFSVLVAPDGKAEKCDVTSPSAFADLNDLSCSLVMRRARFTPAIGADGQPAYGLFRSWASWLVAEDRPTMDRFLKTHPRPSDIDLTLLVKAAQLPAPLDLVVTVDPSGHVGDCQARGATVAVPVAQAACGQLRSQWKAVPGITAAGKAIATVQSAKVDFQPDMAGGDRARP